MYQTRPLTIAIIHCTDCLFVCLSLLSPLLQVLDLVDAKRRKHKTLDGFMSAFYVRWPLRIFFRVYVIYMFGYCLVPFIMLTYARWYPVLTQIYFIGHVLYVPWQFVSPFLKYLY